MRPVVAVTILHWMILLFAPADHRSPEPLMEYHVTTLLIAKGLCDNFFSIVRSPGDLLHLSFNGSTGVLPVRAGRISPWQTTTAFPPFLFPILLPVFTNFVWLLLNQVIWVRRPAGFIQGLLR